MNRKTITILTAVLIGLLFNILFWGVLPTGINYTIFIWLCTAAALAVGRCFQLKFPRWNWIIIVLIGFFSLMFLIRREPFTVFINFSLSFFLLMILVSEFRHSSWLNFGFLDWIKQGFLVWFRLLINAAKLIPASASGELSEDMPKKLSTNLRRLAVGLVITLPVLLTFALLLSSADAVFEQQIGSVLDWIIPESFTEIIFRGFLILLISWLSGGALATAVLDSGGTPAEKKAPTQKIIGTVESLILLIGVNSLFLLFTIIQFSYFFGGDQGRAVAGLTYSDYARQGFSEMTVVAGLSLLIIFVLSSIHREKVSRKQKWLLGMKTLLVAQVIVILVSAFQRLRLYEDAFGFTRLRMYSHIFMIWLGILLAASLALLYLRKPSRFAPTSLAVLMGFAATINFVNVDGLILRNNIYRMYTTADGVVNDSSRSRVSGKMLDSNFLTTLSSDMVPSALSILEDDKYSGVHSRLELVLTCYAANDINPEQSKSRRWQEFHPGEYTADQMVLKYIENNPLNTIWKESVGGSDSVITKDGYELDCYDRWGFP